MSWLQVGAIALFNVVAGWGLFKFTAEEAIKHSFARLLAKQRAEFEASLEDKRQAFAREVEAQRVIAQQALEAFKAQLTLDGDARRQAFARDLEAERQAAQQALEAFKAQLTLAAEVRRQAATKKVTALIKIADVTTSLLSRALYDKDISKRIEARDEYALAVREAEVLLSALVLGQLWTFFRFLQENAGTIDIPGQDLTAFMRGAEAARGAAIGAIRRELQLVESEGAKSTQETKAADGAGSIVRQTDNDAHPLTDKED
jgi:hypothetical protein